MIETSNKRDMNTIELTFGQKTSYTHKPGKKIKIFPFVSNPGADRLSEDLRSFQGVVGEVFRTLQNKSLIKEKELETDSFNNVLKKTVIENVINKIETDVPDDLVRILSDLFFDEANNLVKFHSHTLSYLNFKSPEGALKNLGKIIYDLFFSDQEKQVLDSSSWNNENLFHQVILESLPELPYQKANDTTHVNLIPKLSEQFKRDFLFLKSHNELFLKHIEDLFKYYYFQYFSQIMINFKSFGKANFQITPINFTLDWETLSYSRLSNHKIDWKNHLSKYFNTIFVHANTLELLNNVYINGESIKDYYSIKNLYSSLNEGDQSILVDTIKELIKNYTSSITNFYPGFSWEHCEETLDLRITSFQTECDKIIEELFFKVKYQFDNSTRGDANDRYNSWFINFCKQNYVKNRGRLGNSLVINQELLLLLTRLCISDTDKIRLKSLWIEFEKRGILFDENSKSEIVKLFEKINLIEKKSDSGDAQYVKSAV